MIRPAEERDVPFLVAMGRDFYEASGYAGLAPYDGASAAAHVRFLMAHGLLLVAEDAGQVVGAIGAAIAPFPFNQAHTLAAELFWWLDPQHRGHGPALVDAFEAAAREKGCSATAMMALEAQRPEMVGRLYERRGYRLVEHSYLRGL
jgi:GNAT superfamily N-acetyltransferase